MPASMKKLFIIITVMFGIITLTSCSDVDAPSVEELKTLSQQRLNSKAGAHEKIEFYEHIKPVLDRKCLSCHACFDAPCQLKMENLTGLNRGGSKQKVYNAKRVDNASPTRLGIDAHSESEWRELGFHSVLSHDVNGDSLMKKMVLLGKEHPIAQDANITKSLISLGSKRKSACAKNDEFSEYLEENPYGGMPLAVSGLTDSEYRHLLTWMAEGAKAKTPKLRMNAHDQTQLQKWETWLNTDSLEQALLSRYLYEHLVLGNLYLQPDEQMTNRLNAGENSNTHSLFYKLIRSATPPGEAAKIIATTVPNGPYSGKIYYRLQPIQETIVYKNHIPYRFDNQRLNQYKSLFNSRRWQVTHLPGYDYEDRSNPFETFSAIPAKARYQFLLNDAEYFIRNFIRGPVCHGPIATDVIRDQFWTMFESPDAERYTNDESYRREVTPLLGLPGEKSDLTQLDDQWLSYKKKRNQYRKARDTHYADHFEKGANYSHIWNGDGKNKNAFLSVFRHHDSASVTNGWKGNYPVTAWVLDYPLFERTYYELVVSFNVYGNLSHQLQTRLYFDLIRNGGETNFLRFMPPKAREEIYNYWYRGLGRIKKRVSYHALDTTTPTDISYNSPKPMREFFDYFLQTYPDNTLANKGVNRCDTGCTDRSELDKHLARITGTKARTLTAIGYFPDVTFLNVTSESGNKVFSITRDRMHTNVAFMLGEAIRYEEGEDVFSVLPEILGSYPNLMLSVSESNVSVFIEKLLALDSDKKFKAFIDLYGIRRMNPNFWTELDSFEQAVFKTTPIEAGIFDINRYGYW